MLVQGGGSFKLREGSRGGLLDASVDGGKIFAGCPLGAVTALLCCNGGSWVP